MNNRRYIMEMSSDIFHRILLNNPLSLLIMFCVIERRLIIVPFLLKFPSIKILDKEGLDVYLLNVAK